MAKKIHHFDGFDIHSDSVDIHVDMEQLSRKFNKAQFALDSAIMTSMVPFMPQDTGQFINRTKEASAALAGTGEVVAAVGPEGRFLYEGKTMVDEKTGSPWARKGAKKVLVSEFRGKTNAKPNLTYSGNGQSHWFEPAKAKDGNKWEQVVQKEVSK